MYESSPGSFHENETGIFDPPDHKPCTRERSEAVTPRPYWMASVRDELQEIQNRNLKTEGNQENLEVQKLNTNLAVVTAEKRQLVAENSGLRDRLVALEEMFQRMEEEKQGREEEMLGNRPDKLHLWFGDLLDELLTTIEEKQRKLGQFEGITDPYKKI